MKKAFMSTTMLQLLVLIIVTTGCSPSTRPSEIVQRQSPNNQSLYFDQSTSPLVIKRYSINHDQDQDGIDDLTDIVQGAREEAKDKPSYRNAYYRGGYPPPEEGVCTDVIWRAFRTAGYELKHMVDKDIKANLSAYPRVGGKPDPNIDFRRVPNLVSFFQRHATKLTLEVNPNDPNNLAQWQGGDIVVYGAPLPHIGIISDRRREDGVPFLIHNGGPFATEADVLLSWPSPMTHHFRYPKTD